MRKRIVVVALVFFVGIGCAVAAQQAPARGGGAAQAPAAGAPMAHGNMLQLMRGILFPNSNVIFAAQDDPATVKLDETDPATTPNPLASIYGQWQAVENSGYALAESANLLSMPRACSNGRQAPVNNADWQKFVQGLRDAGMVAVKAAQSRNVDNITMAADTLTTACGNCHDVYREKTPAQGGAANRCLPS